MSCNLVHSLLSFVEFRIDMPAIHAAALVVYKHHPALVEQVGDKFVILLPDGKTKKVRDKDIQLLHPGPLATLDALSDSSGDFVEAWELLQGEQVSLAELAELAYGEFSPISAWSAWCALREGLYFKGEPDCILVQDADQVAEILAAREYKRQEAVAWDVFLEHVQAATLDDADRKRLAEVERVALGSATNSRILSACKVANTLEEAHRLLIRCGFWSATENPWPRRTGIVLAPVDLSIPILPDETRLDLTHLPAWAIDDVGNQDPDDAISLDGDYLWVHIADVAALVAPDSPLDRAARERASNLYLPEQTYAMLPDALVQHLGMGLADQSPALSIGCRFDGEQLQDIRVELSRVQVQRTTYEAVNDRLDAPEFAGLVALTDAYRARRMAQQATTLNLPDVSVKLVDNDVLIEPQPKTPSRDLVADAMVMAGEAVALFAQAQELAIPYAMQPPPDSIQQPETLAEMFAYRRCFKASRMVLAPEPHAGLGLASYTRCTSPLRRYADLVVHQQLRALLRGEEPRSVEQLDEALLSLNGTNGSIRRAERLSNLHWKLVFLQQQPDWTGEGVVVAVDERKVTVLIPALAMEAKLRRRDEFVLDGCLLLKVQSVDIPTQDVSFGVVKQ